MARKCTEYHYFQHTYWDAMARYNWTRCPHCGKLCKPSRFKAATVLVPIEFVIFVVCIFFRNSMNNAIGWFADSGAKITSSQICQTEFTEKMKKIPANPLTK